MTHRPAASRLRDMLDPRTLDGALLDVFLGLSLAAVIFLVTRPL